MRFTVTLNQYRKLMQHYSLDGITLDGARTLTMLLREYNIRFVNMHLVEGALAAEDDRYEFDATDPRLYTLFALRWG